MGGWRWVGADGEGGVNFAEACAGAEGVVYAVEVVGVEFTAKFGRWRG